MNVCMLFLSQSVQMSCCVYAYLMFVSVYMWWICSCSMLLYYCVFVPFRCYTCACVCMCVCVCVYVCVCMCVCAFMCVSLTARPRWRSYGTWTWVRGRSRCRSGTGGDIPHA